MPYATFAIISPHLCTDEKFFKETTGAFEARISTLISWATAEINSYLSGEYTDAELAADTQLAATLESICCQAVDNYLLSIVQRKNSPFIRVNEFAIITPKRIILTADMKNSLERYSKAHLATPDYIESVSRFDNDYTDLFSNQEKD